MESKLKNGEWYILAVIVNKEAKLYFADGWGFMRWTAYKQPNSPSPFSSDYHYTLLRTKLTKTTDNKVSLQWKRLFTQKEIETAQGSLAKSYLAALDSSLSPEERRDYCRLIAEAKKGKMMALPSLGNHEVPASYFRWLERAMRLGDAGAANLLGSEIMLLTPVRDFILTNPAVLLAKQCFDNALKIINNHLSDEEIKDDPDNDNGPYVKLLHVLKKFPEDSEPFQDAISLIHNLEVFYLTVQSEGSKKNIDLYRLEIFKDLCQWFQFEDSPSAFMELIREDSRHVSKISNAVIMSAILIHDLFEEFLDIEYLKAARKCLDKAIELLNREPVIQSRKYEKLAALLQHKNSKEQSQANNIFDELASLFSESDILYDPELDVIPDLQTFTRTFFGKLNSSKEEDSDKYQEILKNSKETTSFVKTKLP